MKKILIYLMVLLIAVPSFGVVSPSKVYKRSAGNFSLPFAGTSAARDAVPTGLWTFRDGDRWYDTSGNLWYTYESAAWGADSGGGGTTLQGAYDFGGLGVGRTITANTGAVVITKNDTGTENQLEINATPSAGADGDGILITNGSNSTGVGVQFANTGSGNDIAGTGDLWTVSKAGLLTVKGGLTVVTGGELLVTARDVLFDDTFDVAWDTSRDTFLFQDNAILGLGGAHDAAADFAISHDGTDVDVEVAADASIWKWGNGTNDIDMWWYGGDAGDYMLWDEGAALLTFVDAHARYNDDGTVAYGTNADFTVGSASAGVLQVDTLLTDNTAQIRYGADTDGIDLKYFGATTGAFVIWDASADDFVFDGASSLEIGQAAVVQFIDDADGLVDWTQSLVTDDILTYIPALSNGTASYNIGDATNTSDFRLFGETASTIVYDATADMVTYNAYDITMNDADIIGFGDSAAEGTIASDGTGLNVTLGTSKALNFLRATAGTINIGVDNAGLDFKFFGEAASKLVWWDQSGDEWFFGADAEGIDVTFYGDTTLKTMKWVEATEVLSLDGDLAMLEFRGASVDAHETTLAVVEPTSSNVITLPDVAIGTVELGTVATTVITADTTATITVVPGTDTLYTYTIDTDNEDCTLTFSAGGTAADRATLIFITDAAGSADEVMTFDGTLAMTEGTLTLANLASNRYVISFVSDGTVWMETSRTAALP